MRCENSFLRQLYLDQHALLKSLEKLEYIQLGNCGNCIGRGSEKLSAELTKVLRDLERALATVETGMGLEERHYFPLLEQVGEYALIETLKRERRQLVLLCKQLQGAVMRFQQDRLETDWDLSIHLVPTLLRQLIRYQFRLEKDYLPLVDYLRDHKPSNISLFPATGNKIGTADACGTSPSRRGIAGFPGLSVLSVH